MSLQKNILSDEEQINLGKIFHWLSIRWYYFLISLTICLCIAFLYLKNTIPIYKVSTSILIDDESGGTLNAEDFFADMGMFNSKNNIENEIGVLQSYTLINRALNVLDFNTEYYIKGIFNNQEIYGNSPFVVDYNINHPQIFSKPFHVSYLSENVLVVQFSEDEFYVKDKSGSSSLFTNFEFVDTVYLGQKVKTDYFEFTISGNPEVSYQAKDVNYSFVFKDFNTLNRSYQSKLQIDPISVGASIIKLDVEGPLVKKEINFLNKLCDVYIQYQLERKNHVAINTIDFIDQQLVQITDSLQGAENELKDFRQNKKTIDLSVTGLNATEQLRVLDNELAQLHVKNEYYEFLLNYLEKSDFNSIIAPASIGIEDPILNASIIEFKKLNASKVELLYTLSPESKEIKILNLKIDNQKKSLIENVRNILNSLKITERDLNSRIASVKSIINRLPEDEQNLVKIQRKFNFSDNLYNYLLQKRAEAGIAKASNMPDNHVLDPARVVGKGPIHPDKITIYFIFALIGLILPAVIIIIVNALNDKIMSIDQVESMTDIPVISSIYKQKNAQSSIIYSPKSGMAESFRALRLNLQFLAAGKTSKVVGFTSTISGEGKTFCGSNLATILAISGKKTIIIGADLRKPRLAQQFESVSAHKNGIENIKISKKIGLSNFLIKKANIFEIIQKTQLENLDIITSGPLPPNPAELLESDQLDLLINDLKKEYDYIIIDAPPLGLVTDYFILSRMIDINLFVIRNKYSKLNFLSGLNKIFSTNRLKNVSIILNDVEKSSSAYGYGGYGYGYYDEDKKKKPKRKSKKPLSKSF